MRRPPAASETPGLRAHAVVLCAAVLWLALARGSTLEDPHYWDALGSYSDQVRILGSRGLDLGAYKGLHYVRPPLFTGALALLRGVGLGSRTVQRLVVWLLGGVLVAATFSITASLQGRAAAGRTGRREPGAAAWVAPAIAAILCATNPLFLAQAGLVQADLPVSALMALAWALLLRGRTAGFVAASIAAVLSKEIAYSLSFPALLLLGWRHRSLWPPSLRARFDPDFGAPPGSPGPRRPRGSLRSLARALLPALVPGLTLLGWELLHRRVIGHILHPGYTQMLSVGFGLNALVNNLTDGGRPVLWILSSLTLFAALRRRAGDPRQAARLRTAEVVITFAAAATLPLFFPAALTRYMMPALPLLCALSALSVARAARPLLAGAALGAASLALAWLGSWHDSSGNHIDCDPTYRKELWTHEQAAHALAAARPRRVLSTFPMYTVLTAPPEDGFLPAPLPAVVVSGAEPLAELCQGDYLVWTNLGEPADAVVATLQSAGALTLWRQWRAGKSHIRIYGIRCP